MKLFLFGGAETSLGQAVPELKMIEKIINESNCTQVLLVPFARIQNDKTEPDWQGGWFNRNIKLSKAEFFNAEKESDIAKVNNPLVFISGGSESARLVETIKAHNKLYTIIKNAPIIVSESAGSKSLGSFLRAKSLDVSSRLMPGLNIIPDTMIEVHYTERNRAPVLTADMNETKVQHGIGVDCLTAMEFELADFPKKYKKIGLGNIYIQ